MPKFFLLFLLFWGISMPANVWGQGDSTHQGSIPTSVSEIELSRLIQLNKLAATHIRTSPSKTLEYSSQALASIQEFRKDANDRDDQSLKKALFICEADALNNMGQGYKALSNYKKATRSFRQALRASIRADYQKGEASASQHLSQLGKGEGMETQLVRAAKDASKVIKEEKIGEKIKDGFEDINRTMVESNARNAERNQDTEKAIRHYERAIGYYESEGDTAKVSETYRHLAVLANSIGKRDEAIRYRRLARRSPDEPVRAAAPKDLDKMVADFKEISAESKAAQAPSPEEIETQKERNTVLEEAEQFARSGNFEASRKRFLQASELQKRLFQLQKERELDSIQTVMLVEGQVQEIEFLTQQQQLKDEQIRRSRTFRNSLIISLLLILAIAGLSSYLFFTKRKSHKQISKAYTQLEETHDQLKQTQMQLVSAEKMASLGQLTAGIAHEINNPVNFISGNIDPLRSDLADLFQILQHYETVIEEENLTAKFETVQRLKEKLEIDYVTEEIYSLLEGIDEGANRTAEIVKGLRTFARLDENDRKPFDAHAGLDSTLSLLKNRCDNIQIIKDYRSIPMIEGYPGKINQVFMNILNNAIQASPKGGQIYISTIQKQHVVEISVQDEGPGIPEEDKKRIFEPFFTTKDVGEGTGLGLSISLGIIEDHRGQILIESEGGQGTKVVIQLPVRYQPSEGIA